MARITKEQADDARRILHAYAAQDDADPVDIVTWATNLLHTGQDRLRKELLAFRSEQRVREIMARMDERE